MTKLKVIFIGLYLITSLIGCGPTAQVINPGGPTVQEAMSESVSGDKMRIAVMAFENRSKFDVGEGMGTMLVTALFRTNKFIVIEREGLGYVIREQRLGTTGIINPETKIPTGKVEAAQLLIFGTISEFQPAQRGVGTSIGGIQQAHVAIDIRIVDAKTSRTVASTSVQGKATDIGLDTTILKYIGMSPLYQLEVWNNTPMGSAIRLCIDRAVEYIVTRLK